MKTLKQLYLESVSPILYHGTNAAFDKFDVKKAGLIHNADWGEGIYFTASKSQAHRYRIDAVKHTDSTYNKIFDEYEAIEKKMNRLDKSSQEYKKFDALLSSKLKEFQSIGRQLDDSKEGRLITAKLKSNAKIYKYESSSGMTDSNLANEVRREGYDVILVDQGKYMEEYVVLNPNAIIITGEIKDI